MYEFLFCPILYIIDEEYHIDTSFAGLDQLEKCSVSRWGRINGVGGHPEVLLAAINHLPHLLEEDITLNDELGEGEADDGLELPL